MPETVGRRSYVRYAVSGAVIVAVAGVAGYYVMKAPSTPTPTYSPTPKPTVSPKTSGVFKLKSDDFEDGGEIPPKFTCNGEDISPQLSWENIPEGTKSFALSVVDPDAPGGQFVHWLVYDIPSDIREIEQGGLPMGSKQVENDFGKKNYGGPCPPLGKHRYIFTIYAIDFEHLEDVNRNNFFETSETHAIAKAELTGLYARK